MHAQPNIYGEFGTSKLMSLIFMFMQLSGQTHGKDS